MYRLGCDHGHLFSPNRVRRNLRVGFSQAENPVIPQDHLLNYSALDKGLYRLKTLFVTLPKTLVKGLKGSPDYTFSDAMLVAKLPYYLGGVFLALSPFIGRNYREGVRQGAAVVSYLLGMSVSNTVINHLYKWRYGVDLTMMYRTKTGGVDQVFASHDFARFDLLKPHHYSVMIDKMGIPRNINEPEGAMRDQVRHIIASSRTLKLVVANLVSAFGAGYVARSNAWLKVPAVCQAIRSVWQTRELGLLQKLRETTRPLADLTASLFHARFNVLKISADQIAVVCGGIVIALATLSYIFSGRGMQKKEYPINRRPAPPSSVFPAKAGIQETAFSGDKYIYTGRTG